MIFIFTLCFVNCMYAIILNTIHFSWNLYGIGIFNNSLEHLQSRIFCILIRITSREGTMDNDTCKSPN